MDPNQSNSNKPFSPLDDAQPPADPPAGGATASPVIPTADQAMPSSLDNPTPTFPPAPQNDLGIVGGSPTVDQPTPVQLETTPTAEQPAPTSTGPGLFEPNQNRTEGTPTWMPQDPTTQNQVTPVNLEPAPDITNSPSTMPEQTDMPIPAPNPPTDNTNPLANVPPWAASMNAENSSQPASPPVGSLSSEQTPDQSEPAPTNLSNITASPAVGPANQPQTVQPETLVMPMPQDANQVDTNGGSKGFPIWVLIVGILVVLAVGGASAYFILGIGQPKVEQVENIPAEIPTPIPLPTEAPISATPSGTVNPGAGGTGSGSSAIDLLRRRQPTP